VSNEWIQQVLSSRLEASALPRLTLREYRKVARDYLPSESQIEAFVEYVMAAKSWYKHLPLWPPGVPFYFFIDPWAGLDRLLTLDGRVTHLRRSADQPGFHYSWMPTDVYRSKFGRLTFAAEAGDALYFTLAAELPDGRVLRGLVDSNWSRVTIHLGDGGELQLPEEVLAASRVELTGMVHPLASDPSIWRIRTRLEEPPASASENAGAAIARDIIARCKRALEEPERAGADDAETRKELEAELVTLLAPERERMRRKMAEAIGAMIRLVRRRFFVF